MSQSAAREPGVRKADLSGKSSSVGSRDSVAEKIQPGNPGSARRFDGINHMTNHMTMVWIDS